MLVGSLSHHIYKELNNDVQGTSYDSYCSEFSNTGNSNNLESYNLCKKISRNTDILSVYRDTIHFSTLCSHYRYWAYYNINKILANFTDNNNAKALVKKFLQVRDNITRVFNAYYCQYSFSDDILQELNNMKEEKYLHDYFKNYDIIKTSDSCSRVTPSVYEKYLNYIITLYNKHKNQMECCIDSFWTECEDYFKCNEEFDPNKLLSILKSNGSKKCDNLIKAQTPPTSVSTTHWGHSLTNVTDSIYYFMCTDIPNGNITHSQQKDGRLRCHRFRTSDRSHNNLISPSLQPPSVQVPFTISGQRGFSLSAELPRKSLELNEHLKKQYILSSSQTLDLTQDKSDDKNSPCKNTLLVRDISGICREPDVRETQTIGVKLNTYAPGRKIKIRLNHNSNMFKNNFFRVGIAFTLIAGIIFTIFLFYKFTPFGRCFHKKVSRKKRIDDYYDDPYMRQFIIRAPK
ncbi:PIR protein [Plasmodium malariae]|uniref:PIR protein n=1 Tax=Plasmodium malariae TaxID=5858 RepID=A0A1D3JJZ3_PLAMA|nr:PIR protein [Plasmodium malariae]SBT86825.1 PIR protein [Plasmodium malariae]